MAAWPLAIICAHQSSVPGRGAIAPLRSEHEVLFVSCLPTAANAAYPPSRHSPRWRCRSSSPRGCATAGMGASAKPIICTHRFSPESGATAPLQSEHEVQSGAKQVQSVIEAKAGGRREPADRPRPCGGCIQSAKPMHPDFAPAKSTGPQAASGACLRQGRSSLATGGV